MVVACFLAWVVSVSAAPQSISVNYKVVNNFPVKYVAVNLNDPEVTVTTALATRFPTGLESWNSIINRLHPDALINGTYFSLRTNMPVGDIAVGGDLIYRGVVGTALCITPDNRVAFRPGPQQCKPDWHGYQSVLCVGPRLLTDGVETVNAWEEGFRDPHVLGSATRSAVAWRPDNSLLLLTVETNISLTNLAYVCKGLGATQAMCLDGGTSSGLYANGRSVTTPGRSVSNVLVIYNSPAHFQQVAGECMPVVLPVLARLTTPRRPMLPGGPAPVSAGDPELVASVIKPPPPTLVKITNLVPAQAVQGVVPVVIEVIRDKRMTWTSLRIDGQLRAMTNIWPMQFQWDSTKELDGMHLLEVTAWTQEQEMLSRNAIQVRVHNTEKVADVGTTRQP